MASAKSVIVGTAGHIDHGKTSLVKALTGIDADRLEEEKRRGITIDIGFAHLELSAAESGKTFRFGFVDVPGHERFVRNMLAGIGGIDFVLLVIAADEGIKPQTREHFEICRLLSVQRGITVLTKSDLVDAETLEVVRLEVAEFMRGSFLDASRSPIIPVSSRSGAGLDDLKRELTCAAEQVSAKDSSALFRLPIDRVFTMKGFGSVVTGTLISGSVAKEDEVEVFPTGKLVRVRGVQVHNQQADRAQAGERTALNLAGVAKEELGRGMTLATPAAFHVTKRADVQLNLFQDAKPLKDRARVHLHSFTAETIAEVMLLDSKKLEPGKSSFVRLRFAESLLLLPGDRFIIRQFSPVVTIGGGVVLDASPLKKSETAAHHGFLNTMYSDTPSEQLAARVQRQEQHGLSAAEAIAETGLTPARVLALVDELSKTRSLQKIGDTLIGFAHFEQQKTSAIATVETFHMSNPLVAGISKEELREKLNLRPEVFSELLQQLCAAKKLELNGEQVRAAGRVIVMKDEESDAKQTIEKAFLVAGLKVPALKDVITGLQLDKARAQKLVTMLLRDRVLVKLADELVFHQDALAGLRKVMADYKATGKNTIDVATFKDLTGISRKYAIPLLEFLDRERVTRREGDKRVIF